MAQTKTLKMLYKHELNYIICPKNAKYEECIDIVLESFNIASKFTEFIQISNEYGNIFDKHTFEYYNLLFPSPEIMFSIKIDYEKFMNQKLKKERKPLTELRIKRKRCDETEEVSMKSKNCSPLYEIERNTSEEPIIKKHKSCLKEKEPKTSWWNLICNKLFD